MELPKSCNMEYIFVDCLSRFHRVTLIVKYHEENSGQTWDSRERPAAPHHKNMAKEEAAQRSKIISAGVLV